MKYRVKTRPKDRSLAYLIKTWEVEAKSKPDILKLFQSEYPNEEIIEIAELSNEKVHSTIKIEPYTDRGLVDKIDTSDIHKYDWLIWGLGLIVVIIIILAKLGYIIRIGS